MEYVYLLFGIGLIAIVAVALWVIGVPQRIKRWLCAPLFMICGCSSASVVITDGAGGSDQDAGPRRCNKIIDCPTVACAVVECAEGFCVAAPADFSACVPGDASAGVCLDGACCPAIVITPVDIPMCVPFCPFGQKPNMSGVCSPEQ